MNTQSTVRLVIGVLGLLALAVVVGGIALALNDKALPGELIAIGSAAAGAVGGILSKTGESEVRVVNSPEQPVPVNDRGHAGPVEAAVVVLLIVAIGILVL